MDRGRQRLLPLRTIQRAAVPAIACGLLWLLCRLRGFVDFYVDRVGPFLTAVLQLGSSWAPLSLATLLIVLAVVLGLAGVILALVRSPPGAGRMRRAARRIAAPLGIALLWAVALFYALWGVQYARSPLEEELGWPPIAEPLGDDGARSQLRRDLQTLAGLLHAEICRLSFSIPRDERGEPRLPPPEALDAAIDEALTELAHDLPLKPAFARSYGPAKRSFLGPVMSALGLSGFYFPFTGEATIYPDLPAWQQPAVIAHEKVHQRGHPNETSANFLGYLACTRSTEPVVRYAGLLMAYRRLTGRLAYLNSLAWLELFATRSAPLQHDVDTANRFWLAHAGWMSDTSRSINDLFLRVNQVPGGIEAYGRFDSLLLVAWQKGLFAL
jgi:hypothetical protein